MGDIPNLSKSHRRDINERAEMGTEEFLLKNYGALLTISSLATVLSRSREGLRLSLRRDSEWTRQINAARVKIGKRIYFRTGEISLVLDGKTSVGTESGTGYR